MSHCKLYVLKLAMRMMVKVVALNSGTAEEGFEEDTW
jgi:hypothetical protein